MKFGRFTISLEGGVWEAEDDCIFGGMVQHGRWELVQWRQLTISRGSVLSYKDVMMIIDDGDDDDDGDVIALFFCICLFWNCVFFLSYMFVVPVDTVLCFHVIHYMLFVYLLMFCCFFFLMNSYLGFHVFTLFFCFSVFKFADAHPLIPTELVYIGKHRRILGPKGDVRDGFAKWECSELELHGALTRSKKRSTEPSRTATGLPNVSMAQGSLSFVGNYYPEADCTTKPLFPTHHG